jgi:membrane associated rhomboid family serine protease
VDRFAIGFPPAGWVSVFRSASRRPCEEQALVLGAMQIEHRISEQPDGCHLLVPAPFAPRAAEQLGLYARENPRGRVVPWPAIEPARGVAGAVLFVAALAALYGLQARYAFGIDWLDTGDLVAGRVAAGEWWRAATALTLHADAAHVAGNMVFGAFFGYLAGQYVGSGIAWLVVTWAAMLANVANAFVQPAAHRSVGASTAVFAALGLVAAFVWARRWAPVVGAVALLAYTGTGDERTDVVAHLAGFVAGALGGAALYWLARAPAPYPVQVQGVAGLLVALTLALAWALALAAR